MYEHDLVLKLKKTNNSPFTCHMTEVTQGQFISGSMAGLNS